MTLRVLTGITTTGTPHLGNYVGAIRPAVAASRRAEVESFYFLADYHALIKCDDPARIQRSRLEIAASWLAAGLDPDKVTFYRQSDIPEIPELTWLLTCVTAKGLMNRAHAYKAAVDANLAAGEDADAGVTMGLYSYPILMAADILMFARRQPGLEAMQVPVGRDQMQHIEMARDIASRFNYMYGGLFEATRSAVESPDKIGLADSNSFFLLPEVVIEEQVATLPGLDGRKMSKSYDNTIPLFEGGAKRLRDSILRIVTDSKAPGEPKDAENSHLFAIYRAFASAEESAAFRRDLEGGLAWGEAKQRLFERLDAELAPMRARYEALVARPADIEDILQAGAKKARAIATPFLAELRAAVGLRSMRELAAPSAQKPKKKGAKGARFVSFREKDGHFHFRFLAADGEELLLSVPFEDPQAAGEWIRVLQKSGGAASFAWGPGDLEIRKTEHVGGHAYELWYGRERLAEGGPRAEPAARDAAVDKLIAEMEALWQQAGEG